MESELRQITERVRAALTHGTVLRVRGGGSKDFYGQSLQGEVLDVSAWRGIISYEPSELVVTVRAGTPLQELQAALAEKGQHLAFEPPCFGSDTAGVSVATCGGMVAAGLSGPARASAGAVRDFVLGVTLLNGRAELLTFGGQVIKNVAGYDVSRLMVGAMGTLGVLTEISLKVLPRALSEATLVCSGLSQQAALDQLHRWGGKPLPLNASCWLVDTSVAPPREHLYVRLRGAAAAVEAACPRMLADLQALGGEAARMDNAQAAPDWNACRDQTLPFFQAPAPELGLWRLSVPQTAPALNLPFGTLVEWHGGQRWLWAPLSAVGQLRQSANSVGGTATLFRAPASVDAAAIQRFNPLQSALSGIHQRLKHEFDPAGIFNRGRMYAQW
ncbi:MAG: glycolate oxidase subunit GlcE [Comamonadaceae bacterium]